jgi:poly(hydroxyalkanoate) depolymerase family esterase
MRSISDTIARLARGQQIRARGGHEPHSDRLEELGEFGSNPGALRGRIYIPEDLSDAAPLVVVLHGCTQTAAGYDHGSGWSRLADQYGFALLFPEQRRANNPNLCFNWFVPEDIRRGSGEALSIRQMTERVILDHGIDRARVFVTGLSAGGAMTSVMLATYPDVYAGGAIIAGLPFGAATTMSQAFDRMRGHGGPDARQLDALVRAASDHDGRWPTVSIWHGSGDNTVAPSNVEAIIGQWRALHGLSAQPTRTDTVDGYPHRMWCDADGRVCIEDYRITGMGHGTPLDTIGVDGCGASGPYMLDVNISSTRHIARFWGLAKARASTIVVPAKEAGLPVLVPASRSVIKTPAEPIRPHVQRESSKASPPGKLDVGRVIEDALRAAGLMR